VVDISSDDDELLELEVLAEILEEVEVLEDMPPPLSSRP